MGLNTYCGCEGGLHGHWPHFFDHWCEVAVAYHEDVVFFHSLGCVVDAHFHHRNYQRDSPDHGHHHVVGELVDEQVDDELGHEGC